MSEFRMRTTGNIPYITCLREYVKAEVVALKQGDTVTIDIVADSNPWKCNCKLSTHHFSHPGLNLLLTQMTCGTLGNISFISEYSCHWLILGSYSSLSMHVCFTSLTTGGLPPPCPQLCHSWLHGIFPS